MENNFFLHIRFGLGVYIVHAKNGIFAIFSELAICKKVIISDISGQTLDFVDFYLGYYEVGRTVMDFVVPLHCAVGFKSGMPYGL